MTENVIKYTFFDVDKDINYIKLNKILNFKITKPTGIYIYGSYGVGKTTLLNKLKENISNLNQQNYDQAIEIAQKQANLTNDLIEKSNILDNIKYPKKISIEFANFAEMINEFQQSWNSKENKQSYLNPINNMAKSNVLILDDIGTEFMHDSTSGFIYELFEKRFEFIDKNNDSELLTIITSNLKFEDLILRWKKFIDEVKVNRIISRLKGIIEFYFEFVGFDKRDLANKARLQKLI